MSAKDHEALAEDAAVLEALRSDALADIQQQLWKYKDGLDACKPLCKLFEFCSQTVIRDSMIVEGGRVYITAGDIDAVWIRDAVRQAMSLTLYWKDSEALSVLLVNLVQTLSALLLVDPYANAFYTKPKISPCRPCSPTPCFLTARRIS